MASSAPSADLQQFIDQLAFDRDSLAATKAAVRTSRDVRREAEEALRALGDGAGNGKDALRRASLLYLLSRPEEALASVPADEGSNQGGLLRGLLALETGDPHGAATAFQMLVGTEIEGPAMLADLATAAALSGDTALAQKAAAKLPDGANALYAEGIALESDGEYDEAQRKYEEAISKDGQHARALFRLALRYDMSGEDERAIEMYRRVVALQPTYVNALINLALLFEDNDRYPEAEQCYRRVLENDANHTRARIGLKDVQASQNMYYDEDHERREDRRNQTLRTPITEFELSVRSRNCLAKMNIETLGDLVKKTEAELLAYKNFGETSLQEIKDILAQKGLRLGMSQEDDAPLYSPGRTSDAAVNALFGAPAAGGAPSFGAPPTTGGGADPHQVPIESLDLSIRARRCMDNLEIRTVGDLVQRTEAELLASKNFGQTSLNEVRRKLEALGMTLRRK
ncbi:MAG: DNA-directed RNA polymerase subunit alpha C-terminal domain-containing protein [Planctomycetota bacterium]|nr:DNA-directed RNA polymerase subunit alpha C-terminal domain-containing protein [Planctomycetota bacterium]